MEDRWDILSNGLRSFGGKGGAGTGGDGQPAAKQSKLKFSNVLWKCKEFDAHDAVEAVRAASELSQQPPSPPPSQQQQQLQQQHAETGHVDASAARPTVATPTRRPPRMPLAATPPRLLNTTLGTTLKAYDFAYLLQQSST